MSTESVAPPSKLQRYAVVIALSAFALGALMNAGVKLLGPDMPVLETLVVRFIVGIIILTPAVLRQGGFVQLWQKPTRKKLLISRAILGLAGVGFSFYGFSNLPLAPATVLWKTGPLLVMLLAGPMIGEPATKRQWFAGLLGLCGTIILVRPASGLALLPALIMIVGAVSAAVSNLQVRELTRTETPTTVVVWYFALAFLICLVGLPMVYTPPTWAQAGLLVWVGVTGGIMMLLNTTAYRLLPPATVATYEYTSILWATLFGWGVWREWPTLDTWLGIALIVAGSMVVSFSKKKTPNT